MGWMITMTAKSWGNYKTIPSRGPLTCSGSPANLFILYRLP
jgi:hypothetical protein